MTRTAIDRPASQIGRIGHHEAMEITAVENRRLLDLLNGIEPTEWSLPTDCTRWDVRALVLHLIGSAEAQANPIEFGRQVVKGRSLTAEVGGTHWVDGLNEAQIRARSGLADAELAPRWEMVSGAALKARTRMPAPMRRLPLLPLGEALGTKLGWQPLSYLFDIGFTRDVWMHRIDIVRALGKAPELTAEHDGRLIADIVAEWAGLHDEPFTLHLEGPAGGRYTARAGAAPITIDAVEFCRVLSGRGKGEGVLRHALPL
jgi:uncharacterized protein (TIGR03083 family)